MKTLSSLPLNDQLRYCPLGTRVWFVSEKTAYTVRARSSRYLVCTKPFNLRRTTLYTIVDLDEQVRGPENLIFGFGAETDDHCVQMIERLHGIVRPFTASEVEQVKGLPRELRALCKPQYHGPTEVSHRNRVTLQVERVKLS